MKLMHTKLPDFIKKMHAAAKTAGKTAELRGLENLKSAKMQSLRTGRIEEAVEELAAMEGVEKVEVVLMPRIPETMHTVVLKAMDKDGNPSKIVLEVINILHPTEEAEFGDCKNIEDRRPKVGLH